MSRKADGAKEAPNTHSIITPESYYGNAVSDPTRKFGVWMVFTKADQNPIQSYLQALINFEFNPGPSDAHGKSIRNKFDT